MTLDLRTPACALREGRNVGKSSSWIAIADGVKTSLSSIGVQRSFIWAQARSCLNNRTIEHVLMEHSNAISDAFQFLRQSLGTTAMLKINSPAHRSKFVR